MEGYLGKAILVVYCVSSVLTAAQIARVNPIPTMSKVMFFSNCSSSESMDPCTFECIFTQGTEVKDIHWAYTDDSKTTKYIDASKFTVQILPKMNANGADKDSPKDVRTFLFLDETDLVPGRYTCMSKNSSIPNALTHTFEVSSSNDLLDSRAGDDCNTTTQCGVSSDIKTGYLCVNHTCECTGYQFNPFICLAPASYEEICFSDAQCQIEDQNTFCSSIYNMCDCVYDYYYDDSDMKCEYDYWSNYLSWSATVAIVVSIVLLLIIIVVFCMIYIRTSAGSSRRRRAGNSTRSADANGSACNSECQMSNICDTPPAYEEIGMSQVPRSETPPPSFDDIIKSRDFLDLTPESSTAEPEAGASGGDVLRLEGVTISEGHLNPAYDGEC